MVPGISRNGGKDRGLLNISSKKDSSPNPLLNSMQWGLPLASSAKARSSSPGRG